jgi:hypothetical protein
LLQRGPVHIAPRETTIVVVSRDGLPAFVLLAFYEGLTGFALGIERVEGLL